MRLLHLEDYDRPPDTIEVPERATHFILRNPHDMLGMMYRCTPEILADQLFKYPTGCMCGHPDHNHRPIGPGCARWPLGMNVTFYRLELSDVPEILEAYEGAELDPDDLLKDHLGPIVETLLAERSTGGLSLKN